MTTRVIESHEANVRLWLEISADGVITDVEHQRFDASQATHGRDLMILDLIHKWMTRLFRTGWDARKEKAMLADFDDAALATVGE